MTATIHTINENVEYFPNLRLPKEGHKFILEIDALENTWVGVLLQGINGKE